MEGSKRAFSMGLEDVHVLDGYSCECILGRILDYIQKGYRRGCSVGIVSGYIQDRCSCAYTGVLGY